MFDEIADEMKYIPQYLPQRKMNVSGDMRFMKGSYDDKQIICLEAERDC